MSQYIESEKLLLRIFNEHEKIDAKDFQAVTSPNETQCWYSWLTDYTLRGCFKKMTDATKITEINLIGNDQITDQGIIWMCEYLKNTPSIKSINLKSCSKLSETSLFAIIALLKGKSRIDMGFTSIQYVPKECLEYHDIGISSCSLGYQPYAGQVNPIGSYSLILWPSKSIEISGVGLLSDRIEKSNSSHYLEHATDVKIDDDIPLVNILNYKLTEVPIHIIVPKCPGQVILLLSDKKEEACNHLVESVAYFLASESPIVACPKFVAPPKIESHGTVTDERQPMMRQQEMVIQPKMKSKFQPKMKSKIQPKMKSKKRYVEEAEAEEEEEDYYSESIIPNSITPFLEQDNFGYRNVKVEDNSIYHLRDIGCWISKQIVNNSHCEFEISALHNMDVGSIVVGICPLRIVDWITCEPMDDYLMYFDITNYKISYKRDNQFISYLIKNPSPCNKVKITIKKRSPQTSQENVGTFLSVEMNGTICWSFVFTSSQTESVVPFVTIDHVNSPIQISGDWDLWNIPKPMETKVESFAPENILKFIAICVGDKFQDVHDAISALDWKERMSKFTKKLEDLISSITKKDAVFIDFSDTVKLSEATRQLEQINAFTSLIKERLFLFKLDKLDNMNVSQVLKCIGNNIKKEMELRPYRFAASPLKAASQKVINLNKRYVTADLLLQLGITQSESFCIQIFEKMFTQARGIFFKQFKMFVFDIAWFDTLLNETITKIPLESNYQILGVHGSAKVWTLSSLVELLMRFKIDENDHTLWINLLMDMGLLVRLPCIRQTVSDELYMFVNPMLEGTGKKSHLDMIRNKAETIPKKLEAKVKFEMISQDLYSLYPQLLSKVLSIGSLQLISSVATVCHISGGVELFIEAGEDHITLSAYIPMPLSTNSLDKFNLNLIRYLWSVLYLYVDVFDALLSQQNILAFKHSSTTGEGPINFSVCYNHNWQVDNERNNICTLCGNCSSTDGINCPYNRIGSQRRGICLCLKPSRTCSSCGICEKCAKSNWKTHCESDPCRLIVCEPNGLLIPNPTINVALSPKFRFEIYNDTSDLTVHLSLNETEEIIDIVNLPGTDYTNSKQKLTVLSFGISELHFAEMNKFQFSQCSGINFVHELGILTFDDEERVGLCVGRYPISKERNRFSFEIQNCGESGKITIGLVVNDYPIDQPGFHEYSIAYHGDNGGIFISALSPNRTKETFSKIGNRMELIIDYETSPNKEIPNRFITWKTNGQFVERFPIEYDGDLYPAIGLHSIGEQIKLLDNLVWQNNEFFGDTEELSSLEVGLTVSPKKYLYLKSFKETTGLFHIISRNVKIKSFDFELIHKHVHSKTSSCTLKSFNKLLSTSNKPHKWLFDNFSNFSPDMFTFQLKTANIDDIRKLKNHVLRLIVSGYAGENISIQWELTNLDSRYIKSNFVEVPDKDVVATHPSYLLTINQTIEIDSIDKSSIDPILQDNITTRYFHIAKGKYKLSFSSNRMNSWIRCGHFMKPKFTRSYQIGNIISKNSKPSMVIHSNQSTSEIKVTGFPNLIPFKSNEIAPLMKSGKVLLSLISSKNNKYKYFTVANKHLLLAPPPSRPWLLSFYQNDDNLYPLSNLYFANDCSEYHGIDICIINALSASREDLIKSDDVGFTVALPFNQNDQDIEHFLWEHSFIDLISLEKMLFYPVCSGKSAIYDSKPHILDMQGKNILPENISAPEVFKAIFFNQQLLNIHKFLLNDKFLLPKFQNIVKDATSSFSETQIEFLVLSIFQKVTNFMILTNLLCDEKSAFVDKLNTNVFILDNIHGSANSSVTMDANCGICCKLHDGNNKEEINFDEFINADNKIDDNNVENVLLKNNLFDYAKCAQSVIFLGTNIQELPEEIFLKFSNLNSLELRNMLHLENLPQTIYNLRNLQRLVISHVKIKKLPDAWRYPNLKHLQVTQCPIVDHNEGIGSKKLETIILHSLPMIKFPLFLCHHENIVSLQIELRGLEDLPKEFTNLINLKELKLIGSPIYYEILKNEAILKLQENLEFEYPEIDIYAIIDKTKHTTTFLPVADVFVNVPRIGSGYSKSADSIAHGGFPTALLQLRQLRTLIIQHQALRYVPSIITNLENLETADFSFNPLLETIPGEISRIKSMKKLTALHCPSLTVPPPEVISRGSAASLAYLKYLLAKNVVCNRTKLMFVGLGEAGKTSLLYALRSETNSANTLIEDQNKVVTDGIDITQWTVSQNGEEDIQFSTWDFAGQDVYYNTHQFFLSSKAIYIVVWSVRQGIEHGDLDFWLSSIACHAKDAPMFVVGTRCDQVQADLTSFSILKRRYPQIEDFRLVDSYSGTGIKELRERLMEVTMKLPYMRQAIPTTILELETNIIQHRSKRNHMKFQEFEEIALKEGILKNDVKDVMHILHDFGSIQYFDTEMLRNYVVINPQWIVDIMANVVSIVNQKIKTGIFYHKDMKDVWKSADENLNNWMLNLTEEFDLTYPHPTMEPKANMVPCLLSEEEPAIEWPQFPQHLKWKYYQINYEFDFLPAGLFNRIQVRLFDFTETKEIWKFGTYFLKNHHHILFKREKKNLLTIRALGVRPVNVMAMIDDVIRGLIRTSFHGVKYKMEIACPDCIEYGENSSSVAVEYWTEVSMISSKTIKKAITKKVEYLQCTELHLNSMKAIKENTPETASAEDFIRDLKSKVQIAKSLYASTDKSIVMLYSEADFKESSNLSFQEFEDIFTDLNITCLQISESLNPRWKTAIANCNVCLITLSENFIKIHALDEVQEYIKLMNKRFILAIVGTDRDLRLNWKFCPYFMTVYIKINSPDKNIRKEHLKELRNAIKHSISDSLVKEVRSDSYDCFISYCWANSQDAVNKGTKSIPGAISSPEADPRKLCKYLMENGLNCWIDENNLNKNSGLNKQLSQSLQKSKIMIAFVSHEYSKSEHCKMELNFMVEELRRPVVFVIIGVKDDWRFRSEVSLIMQKGKETSILDFKVKVSNETLLENVKSCLEKCESVTFKKNTKSDDKAVSSALIEQVELINRQFLNHLISLTQENCPRLVVLDIDWVEEKRLSISDEVQSDTITENIPGQESDIQNNHITSDKLYLKIICENEGCWHVIGDKYTVHPHEKDAIIESCAVYLYMIYRILEYKNPGLNCLDPKKMMKTDLISRITQIAKSSEMSFKKAYTNMIQFFMKYDVDLSQCSLKRYRLASGRELWMCDRDASSHPRCKLIERDAATTESMIIPVEEFDKTMLMEIKSKSADELLKYTDSFRQVVETWKTFDNNKSIPIGHLSLTLPFCNKLMRSDTILTVEKDIATNTKGTYIVPIRPRPITNVSVELAIANEKSPVPRKTSLVNRTNLVGSRICSIQ